ncbi:ammonium transporter [Leptolyngbya sp. Heron Island J]|uniref:ammonium transporter n=1 Tax=Leptolyngbya sp. Heron Island J TaxID=1385935 RepID=UPI0003B99771|nr:ammonium transporter [Leptolyngbya sp. Heron Island J]ESA32931.1 ammonium transporter [Leptolyngbya sp. Heron Island J]
MESSFDVLWVILCAILVSTMQAGFCCLESGLVRAKNSINVAIKNLVDFCIASLIFSLIAFRLMFGETAWGLIGTQLPTPNSWSAEDYTFFLFELAFCGTATTIVSGAVAERMRFSGYFFTSVIVSALIYPVVGHWVWGGLWFETGSGWLRELQFHDFAGATVVHSVGGWMAFSSILILGPRLGRFNPNPRPINGHNLPTAVLGVFLLWFGWFGFNGGSGLAFDDQVPRILVNTAEGGAAGGFTALVTTWILHKRPKVPVIMNGVIGGLVSVTAGCDVLWSFGAISAGSIGGLLCTFSTQWLNHFQIDDAVGVVPAHLVCGIWGTLTVALFGDPQLWAANYTFLEKLGIQALGISVTGLYAFVSSYALLKLIDYFYPLRVTPEQEYVGLNISEHNASTATQALITSMNNHSLRGDFTQLVVIEPGTDVAPIANHYNQVLTKMNQIQADLNASQDRLLTIINSPAFPVVISTPHSGIIQFINQRAAELFGFTLQETGRYRETDFWHDLTERDAFLIEVNTRKRVHSFETCLRNINGTSFWSLISGLEMHYDNQACVLFSFSDISTQIERETTLRKLASIDPLTGIYNRRAFLEQANKSLSLAKRQNWPVVILMIDIDHFKSINDQFGHAKGDLVIRSVAKTCSSLLREHDVVGRFGGEEFVVLLSNTSLHKTKTIAERLRQQVEQLWIVNEPSQMQVTVSIGIADMQPDESLEATLKRSDRALYQAKAQGRNRVEYWHQTTQD